jgi:hypothetical protein
LGPGVFSIFKAFRELFKLWWKLKFIDPNQDGIFAKPVIALAANNSSADRQAG